MEVLKWLTISDRYSRMFLDRELSKMDLNSHQHFYILKICEEPGITQDRLISLVHVNPSNVTRAIAYLEKEGFLERRHNMKDRRTFHLYPTKRAQDAYPRIQEIKQHWEADLLEVLSLDEAVMLEGLLTRVGQHAVEVLREEKENRDDDE